MIVTPQVLPLVELGDMSFTAKLAHFHAQSARRFRKKIIQVIRLTT